MQPRVLPRKKRDKTTAHHTKVRKQTHHTTFKSKHKKETIGHKRSNLKLKTKTKK